MSIEELLEQFDEILDGGVKLPGKRTVVDVEKLRALVDDIRLNIPVRLSRQEALLLTAPTLSQTQRERLTALSVLLRSALRLSLLRKKLHV